MAKLGGYSGLGTILAIKIGGTFTTIGEVVSSEGPDPVLGTRDATVLSSASKVKRPTIADLGKVKFTIHFDPDDTTHILLAARVTTPPAAPDEFKLTYPTGDTTPPNDDFKGYAVSFKRKGFTEKDTIAADVEIDVTDLFTSTAGTP